MKEDTEVIREGIFREAWKNSRKCPTQTVMNHGRHVEEKWKLVLTLSQPGELLVDDRPRERDKWLFQLGYSGYSDSR